MSMQIRGPLTFFVKRYLIIVSHVVQSLFILSFLKFLIAIDSWWDKIMKCLPYVHILFLPISRADKKMLLLLYKWFPYHHQMWSIFHFEFINPYLSSTLIRLQSWKLIKIHHHWIENKFYSQAFTTLPSFMLYRGTGQEIKTLITLFFWHA